MLLFFLIPHIHRLGEILLRCSCDTMVCKKYKYLHYVKPLNLTRTEELEATTEKKTSQLVSLLCVGPACVYSNF